MFPRGSAQVRGFIDSGSGWDGAGRLMMGAGMEGDPMMDDGKPETVMSGKAQEGRRAGGYVSRAFRVVTPQISDWGPTSLRGWNLSIKHLPAAGPPHRRSSALNHSKNKQSSSNRDIKKQQPQRCDTLLGKAYRRRLQPFLQQHQRHFQGAQKGLGIEDSSLLQHKL